MTMNQRRCSGCVLALAFGLLVSGSVPAGLIPGKVLAIAVHAQPGDGVGSRAAEAEAAVRVAAEAGADSVCFMLPAADWASAVPWVGHVSAQAEGAGIAFWLGLEWSESVDLEALAQPVERAVLLFPGSGGERIPAGDFEQLLRLKQAGDRLAVGIRAFRRGLRPDAELSICLDATALDPERAVGRHVPVRDLVRDGTLAVAWLSGADRINFHRLRLLRDAPLGAGLFLDGRAIAADQQVRAVARVTQAALQNAACGGVWVCGVAPATIRMSVLHTVEALQREAQRRQGLQSALESGTIVMDAGVPGEKRDNQATVHGVAQSFVPSRDGVCRMAQVYAALRRCRSALPPELCVEIRPDTNGRPGEVVLAVSAIPAAEFGHEPTYRWGTAEFAEPVHLERGQRYWLHLPDAQHPDGAYLWGIVKDGAAQYGAAWSGRYDYARHSWVYRVYMNAGEDE